MKVKDVLDELPPSASTVYDALCHEGECTQRELSEKTHLAPRTVRKATTQLKEDGLIEERISVQDARQRLYSISK